MTSKRLSVASFVVVLACGITRKPELVVYSAIVDHLAPATTITAAAVESLPQVVDATYRLRPDRRFLLAVSDLVALNTGRHEPVEIDFSQGRWMVRCEKQEVGTLPDMPTFGDAMAMLTKWAAALRPATVQSAPPSLLASLDRDLEELTTASLFRAAGRIDPTHGASDLPVATRLARAMTLLNLMADEDRFGLADPLRARALALIAMARAIDATAVAEEQAVMARSMGYDTEASAAAAGLAPASFARVWITGVGSAGPKNVLSDYVAAAVTLRTAAKLSSDEALAPWRSRLGNRVVPLLLAKLQFETQQDAARRVSSFLATDHETDALDPGDVVTRFESALAGRAAAMASITADADIVESYYKSLFYSALDAEFRFHFDGMASAELTAGYVHSLKPRSPVGREVASWMSSMLEAKYGGATAASLGSIERLRGIGAARRAELLAEIADRIGRSEPAIRQATDTLFPQLDTRPEVLFRAGVLASTIIADPLHRDRYIQAVIDRAPLATEYGTLAWYYHTIRDIDRLRLLVDLQGARAADRARALSYLSELGRVDDDFVDARFERLLTEAGFGAIYPIYTEVLNRRHAWKQKERVARRAIKENTDQTAISAAYYASSLADALERQGRYEEAWKIVRPHIPVWSANIIAKAVSLLQRTGRETDANELGRRMVERYPSSGRFDFAPVLWREHRYADAARLFDPKETTISHADWDLWMPAAFADAFEADIPGAIAAFRALIETRLDPNLLQTLPRELLERKNAAAAFAVAEQLVQTRPSSARDPYAASHLILAYRALKAMKDEAVAIEWLHRRVPSGALLETIVIAYEEGEYPLVAALRAPVPDPSEQIQIESCYAAALVSMRVAHDDPRWNQLIAETRSRSSEVNSVVDMTRYLLGTIDQRSAAASRETRSTIEYFIGLKAAADGDYDRALPFLLAAARGSFDEPPPAWATTLLYRWSQAGTWSDVKRRRVL